MGALEEKIPNGWRTQVLEDVAEKIIDYRGKTPKKLGGDWSVNGKYRALSAKSVKTGGLVNEDQINRVDEDLYQKWMKDEIQRNDILLTSEAPMGEVLIWESDEKIVLSQRLFAIRAKKEVSPKYLYYFFTSRYFQAELAGRQSGSTVTGIRQTELLRTRIILPEKIEQDAIANTLAVFDEKINLLKEQNKTLEKIAQAVYKHWFIDFEFPDENGDPYQSSGGKMVDSELGSIPEGWSIEGVRKFVTHVKTSIKPTDNPDTLYNHCSIPAFDNGERPEKQFGVEIKSNKYAVQDNVLLVSKLNPSTPRVWVVLRSNPETICSTEFQVLQPDNKQHIGYVWAFLKTPQYVSLLSKLAHGTSSSHQRVSPDDILDTALPIPPDNLVGIFSQFVNSTLYKIEANKSQIEVLAKTRDMLAPKLLKGEIRVTL